MASRKKQARVKPLDEKVMNRIYVVRDQKVMLDRDLADLYGIETKSLKQAVKRNTDRFPKDFMFEMSIKELKDWRSQFVTSNSADAMGLRHRPFCFTEQGVAMLSSVLHSPVAIKVNIQIIRVFTKMKEFLSSNKDILLKLEALEKDVLKNQKDIGLIFSALNELVNPAQPKRRMIGFNRKDND
jgi:ORF6N domain